MFTALKNFSNDKKKDSENDGLIMNNKTIKIIKRAWYLGKFL